MIRILRRFENNATGWNIFITILTFGGFGLIWYGSNWMVALGIFCVIGAYDDLANRNRSYG